MAKKQRVGCISCKPGKRNDMLGICLSIAVFLLLIEAIIMSRDMAFLVLFLIILTFIIVVFVRNQIRKV